MCGGCARAMFYDKLSNSRRVNQRCPSPPVGATKRRRRFGESKLERWLTPEMLIPNKTFPTCKFEKPGTVFTTLNFLCNLVGPVS